jgi:predicted nucleic acid-binding protein
MRPEVFVDTSAWIAISDLRDRYHAFARAEQSRLLTERWTLITTNLVIGEAYIIIRRSGGHSQGMHFLQALRTSPRVARVHSTAELELDAEEILKKFQDQAFSYVDAVSFGVMQARGIEHAFTFDSHFAVMKFKMIPVE